MLDLQNNQSFRSKNALFQSLRCKKLTQAVIICQKSKISAKLTYVLEIYSHLSLLSKVVLQKL